MNTKNLILTPISNMGPEQWFAWRQPMTHVKEKLIDLFDIYKGESKLTAETLFNKSSDSLFMLQDLFATDEWKAYVFPCVGGSEIAAVVGLNPYQSVIELYYEKVGVKNPFKEQNAAMFWGKTLEATIAEQWQYWDGSSDSVINNCNANNIVRRCRRINFYAQNKNFPWIFVSLDRVINKHGDKAEGSLECKTISGFAADKWQDGIPPMYVAQLQTQLGVYEFTYGEQAILKDGRDFNVYQFDLHVDIVERLKKESEYFFGLVKKGIENVILASVCTNEDEAAKYGALVDQYSPEPDGSLSYESFLSDKYNQESGYEINGGLYELDEAKSYIYYKNKIKELEGFQLLHSNRLKAFIKDAAVINFGEEGKVSWKANAKGSRVFLVKVNCEEDFMPTPQTAPLAASTP